MRDIKTGRPLTEADLTKDEYTGKDFDDELFIELRTPKMCADLFQLLCENGGPEQKVIIFCTREIHADRVAQHMNNLYVRWCKEHGRTPKDHYAFKCMGGANNGADMIEPMRGSGERAFIACTVDLLEAGVDIERLNAVVFFRYLQSPIKFYQMVGRGTRIHEETQKYKFWLYDCTDVTSLFGTDFITKPPRPGGGGRGDGGDTGGGGEGGDGPAVGEIGGQRVSINAQGRFILSRRDGRDTPIPVDEYRREVIQRVIAEAHKRRVLDEIAALLKLRSKHVVQVYDVLALPGEQLAIVQEFVEGTDLDVKRSPVTTAEALYRQLWQIASGISDIHAAGLIHRDIKPNNMKRDGEGVIKIFDFGLARSEGTDAKTSGFVGTQGFAAPELYRSSSSFTQAVDTYAFGISALYFVAGTLPPELREMPPAPGAGSYFSGFRYSQAVRELVIETAETHNLSGTKRAVPRLAAHVTLLAVESSLIKADQTIGRDYVRRVIAAELGRNLGTASTESVAGIHQRCKRTPK